LQKRKLTRFEIARRENIGSDARFFNRDWSARGRDHHAVARWRPRQRDLVVARFGEAFILRGEAGLGDDGVALVRHRKFKPAP
jgi:hypothetical protein